MTSAAATTSLEEIIPQLLTNVQSENYSDVLSTTTELLDQDGSSNIDEPLSESLKKTVQDIHCRVLIALSKYSQLVDYYHKNHHSDDGDNSMFLEYTYSLYKLGRYVQCRDLIQAQLQTNTSTAVAGADTTTNKNGLMHILAQCQYRLHQTKEASSTYLNILEDESHDIVAMDNQDEVLTNALAVHISNMTNHVTVGEKSTSLGGYNNRDRLNDDILEKMKQIELSSNGNDDYLYELVYNAGTKLLLESTSLIQTKKAIEWLSIAQQKCMDEYKEEEEAGATENIQDQYQNLMPIQANIALGKMNSGDLNGSTRSYLELLLTMKKMDDKTFTGGGTLLAIDNNLAVLNSMKKNNNNIGNTNSSSVYELLKRVPELEGGGGNAVSSSNRITPNQARTILYNRAVLLQKMNKHAECKAVLSLLQNLLTDNNDGGAVKRGNKSGGGAKKKRKKGGNNNADASDQSPSTSSSLSSPLMAPVATEAEIILWNSRIELLQNEISSTSSSKDGTKKNSTAIEDGIASIADKIKLELQKKAASSPSTNEESEINILEYALAEVLLYQAQKKLINAGDNEGANMEEKMQQLNLISTLENLPESMRARPAIVATLCSLYSKLSMDDKVKLILESTTKKSNGGDASSDKQGNENLTEYKRLGDFKLRLGLYEEAAAIYKSILSELEENNNSHSIDDNAMMECKAGLIKAMSYFDIENAIEYAEEVSFEHENLDGEELEAMDIPRLSKGASGSSKVRKILANRRNTEEK